MHLPVLSERSSAPLLHKEQALLEASKVSYNPPWYPCWESGDGGGWGMSGGITRVHRGASPSFLRLRGGSPRGFGVGVFV